MVVAWVTLISTAFITARYSKDIFPERRFCGVKIWFILHWPVMVSAVILSIISLLVILSGKNQ